MVTLAQYVDAEDGDPFVSECETEAKLLVSHRIGTATVPDEIRARAELEAGAALVRRRQAQDGVATFSDGETMTAVRVSLDPMKGADAILARWLGPAIA